MASDGAVLHREKSVQQYHWLMSSFAAVFALVAIVGLLLGIVGVLPWVAAGPIVASAAPFAALMALVWVLFSVVRVQVTRDVLSIQVGPFGPKIALDSIVSCAVVAKPEGRYRGGGVRVRLDGTKLYEFMLHGSAPTLVKIEFREGTKTHTVLLSSDDPAALASAINAARERTGTTGVRAEPASTTAESADGVEVATANSAASGKHG